MKIMADDMQSAAGAAEEMLKALANRHRLMILCQILESPRTVGDLAVALGLRVPAVSQHLAVLRRDKLVTARRDGQAIWYSVASSPARRLVETLYDIYCSPKAPRSRSPVKRAAKNKGGENTK